MEYALKQALDIYIWFCVVILIIYIPRISYYFCAFIKQKKLFNHKYNKIAVIIPARDEGAVITNCLDSLTAQTYNPQNFDIHIVVADETDPTIKIAAAYKQTYVTVIHEQTCKGDALDGVLKSILSKSPDKYDAFVIIDADNLAAPDFLEEMNNALSSGKQIICAKKLIKNWKIRSPGSRSFVSNCTALTYTQIDELGNRARNLFGMTIIMIGTGMMVRADVIKDNNGWPYRSLTEDYEMAADSIVKGWSSMYYSHAKVYTEESTSAKTAYKRKIRWIKGYTQCQWLYFNKIISKIFSGDIKRRNLDFLISPYPAYAFFAGSAVMMIICLIAAGFSLLTNSINLTMILHIALFPFSFVYGVLFIFTLITLIADWRYIKIPFHEKLTVLFFNPIYMLGYFRVFIAAFFTNFYYFKWEPTERILYPDKAL